MWKPWEFAVHSNERAVANARAASTELSRLRVERAEIELYVEQRTAVRRMPSERPA